MCFVTDRGQLREEFTFPHLPFTFTCTTYICDLLKPSTFTINQLYPLLHIYAHSNQQTWESTEHMKKQLSNKKVSVLWWGSNPRLIDWQSSMLLLDYSAACYFVDYCQYQSVDQLAQDKLPSWWLTWSSITLPT